MTRARRNELANHLVPKVRVPDECIRLWNDFWELCAFRDEHKRITPRAMMDYAEFKSIRWQKWQRKALMRMDAMWVQTTAAEVEHNRAQQERAKRAGEQAGRRGF